MGRGFWRVWWEFWVGCGVFGGGVMIKQDEVAGCFFENFREARRDLPRKLWAQAGMGKILD